MFEERREDVCSIKLTGLVEHIVISCAKPLKSNIQHLQVTIVDNLKLTAAPIY